MPPVAFELTGLGRGGQQVQKCKETFSKAMEALVDIASLQVRNQIRCSRRIND
jgi:V-type H+-transporting ATPase subunit D